MADERIRHASVYLEGKKVASAKSGSFSINSGDESQIADEGFFGHADGATTSTLSIDTIEPVRETDSKKIIDALLQKKYIKLAIAVISGGIYEVTMRPKSVSFDWDATAGTLNGKFEFEGGEPKRTGINI